MHSRVADKYRTTRIMAKYFRRIQKLISKLYRNELIRIICYTRVRLVNNYRRL